MAHRASPWLKSEANGTALTAAMGSRFIPLTVHTQASTTAATARNSAGKSAKYSLDADGTVSVGEFFHSNNIVSGRWLRNSANRRDSLDRPRVYFASAHSRA